MTPTFFGDMMVPALFPREVRRDADNLSETQGKLNQKFTVVLSKKDLKNSSYKAAEVHELPTNYPQAEQAQEQEHAEDICPVAVEVLASLYRKFRTSANHGEQEGNKR